MKKNSFLSQIYFEILSIPNARSSSLATNKRRTTREHVLEELKQAAVRFFID